MDNRYMKRCSTSQAMVEIQIKPQWYTTSHLLEWLLSIRQEITSVGENVEKEKPSFTASGNVNWYSHYGKQSGGSSKAKNRELP